MKPAEISLVIGGARSGKSSWAEALVQRAADAGGKPEGSGRVLYIATAEAGDEEMRGRIRRHQARRPSSWSTLEAPLDAPERLADLPRNVDAVLFDCLTLYLSNWMFALEEKAKGTALVDSVLERVDELIRASRNARVPVVWVTNEVGGGVVPAYPLGRLFRDLAGIANQRAAQAADRVYLTVAGIPIDIKELDARRTGASEGRA